MRCLSTGFEMALRWLWCGFVLRSLCLVYAYSMALGWPWGGFGWLAALPRSKFEVRCSAFDVQVLNHRKANWRLYVLLALGAAAGVALFWWMIVGGGHSNAGFAMKDFTWYQYLFTQFRTVFAYLFNF